MKHDTHVLIPAGKVTLLASIIMQAHRYGVASAAQRCVREGVPFDVAIAVLAVRH